jgi:phosphoglycerol transferase MdoB-like AlkP superfamily enzyme
MFKSLNHPKASPQSSETSASPGSNGVYKFSLPAELVFIVQIFLLWMMLFTAFRAGLLMRNWLLFSGIPAQTLLGSFLVGARFDCLITCQLLLPLLAWLLIPLLGWQYRDRLIQWLPLVLALLWSPLIFLSMAEWEFYREFQERFNNLAIQYISDDPSTVLSMIWHGYPVLWYGCIWLIVSGAIYYGLHRLLRQNRLPIFFTWKRHVKHVLPLGALMAILLIIGARGTLRQGPPLRWGDAYFSDSSAANQLALNGLFSLSRAAIERTKNSRSNFWLKSMPEDKALTVVRNLVLQPEDRLLSPAQYPLLRIPGDNHRTVEFSPRPHNLVIILMESFSGEFVHTLGAPYNATPRFDQICKQGILFDHFFSQGSHTHQGIFATLCSFPNLPDYEFLMSNDAGMQPFISLPSVLKNKGYHTLYVYNGSNTWDNQEGFFRNQGMQLFIGRDDYIKPLHNDPTWGVSDEDMFMRAAEEISRLAAKGPTFALLQTLSNHAPFNLPPPAPFNDMSGPQQLLPRLNGIRYADWALGNFFDMASKEPWFKDTLFVILGDHGFPFESKQAELDLDDYHVPLLIYYPGDTRYAGRRIHTVASQVDVLPTSLGLLGIRTAIQAWGRDLFRLDSSDLGWAVLKPAGNSQKVAFIKGNSLLVVKPGFKPDLWKFELNPWHAVKITDQSTMVTDLSLNLSSYLNIALSTLIKKQAGITADKILTLTKDYKEPYAYH